MRRAPLVPSRRVLSFACALAVLAPAVARPAAKPHCRDLVFAGSAGLSSNDKVTLRVTDTGGTTIETSCPLQVQSLESARAFANRLVAAWGDGGGGLVGVCPNANPPAPLPTKSCGNQPVGTRSCKHKFKFKPDTNTLDPNDGLIRIRICCKAGNDCRGPNLVGATPVSVQSKKDPAVVFTPTVPPPVGVEITGLSIDPIDMTQLPGGTMIGCRKDLGLVVRDFARRSIDALVKGQPPDPTGIAKLHEVAAKCQLSGALAGSLGYGQCGPPCNGIQVGHCTAGTLGLPCALDADCDTITGSGDGRCTGDWNLVADCLACRTTAAVFEAYDQAYGTGPQPTPEAQHCQDTIGKALAGLIGAELGETVRCQKLLDAGNASLPMNAPGQCQGGTCTLPPCVCTAPPLKVGAPCAADGDCNVPAVCKRADLVGRRADAAQAVAAHIQGDPACNDTTIADDLDTCDVTQAGAIACVTAAGEQASREIADAVFPEGAATP